MIRTIIVLTLALLAACIHRPIDPVVLPVLNSCNLMTVRWGMITYPPVAGHCLSPKEVLRELKSKMERKGLTLK